MGILRDVVSEIFQNPDLRSIEGALSAANVSLGSEPYDLTRWAWGRDDPSSTLLYSTVHLYMLGL